MLKEKDTLVDRLGGLEARQRSLHEREQQAGDRGTYFAESIYRPRVFTRLSRKIKFCTHLRRPDCCMVCQTSLVYCCTNILNHADACGPLRLVVTAVKFAYCRCFSSDATAQFSNCSSRKRVASCIPIVMKTSMTTILCRVSWASFFLSVSVCCHADGEASAVRQELEKDLQNAKQRVSEEAQLRGKEAAEFADRLKEVRCHTRQWVQNEFDSKAGAHRIICSFPNSPNVHFRA